MEIKAYIYEIRGNRAGDRAEKITVSASYESASIMSSITFDVPIEQASEYYIGQEITITISKIK